MSISAIGTYTGVAVPLSFEKSSVEAMLPKQLTLVPQTIVPSHQHPILLMFGQHQDVHMNILPMLKFSYHEFALSVPYVQFTDSGKGPFTYMPALYLDAWFPVLAGYFWGFAKAVARINTSPGYYAVSNLKKQLLISTKYQKYGVLGPPTALPHFEALQSVFEQPVVGHTLLGPFVCFTFGRDNVQVQPTRAEVTVSEAFVSGLPTGQYQVNGIDVAPLGGFYIENRWQLHLPKRCSAIQSKAAVVKPTTLSHLKELAQQKVAAVADNPEGRYQLRTAFYQKYGFGEGAGYGTSELAFMRWEIKRGVLNPLPAGSMWWHQVNETFIYIAELAALVHEHTLSEHDKQQLNEPVKFWLAYFQHPSSQSWYKAHNATIVAGYLQYAESATNENKPEQLFMNIVLYRLLYAQAIIEGVSIFGELGKILADPVLPTVGVLVHLPAFYPRHYPLTQADIRNIMHAGHTLIDIPEDILDEGLILPQLSGLYQEASTWLKTPQLTKLVVDNQPVYPHYVGATKTKVAILGGGVGAMVTAFALTDPKNPQHDQYEITVYQLGWRLGGKGASGRNMDIHYRIEEHGIHVWFGWYANAFQVIQKCYTDLNRAPDLPLATWQEAFNPCDDGGFIEFIDGKAVPWPLHFPGNPGIPGESILGSLWEHVTKALALMLDHFKLSSHASNINNIGEHLLSAAHTLAQRLGEPTSANSNADINDSAIKQVFDKIAHLFEQELHNLNHAIINTVLDRFMGWFWEQLSPHIQTNVTEQRIWIVLNFFYANLGGIIADDLVWKGFNTINDQDYRTWLGHYAFDDGGLMLNSPIALNIYYGLFAYENGDLNQPNLEAGTTLKVMLRTLSYKGAMVWKMQAGMGDTIFAPMYEVLKKRGVTFKYFHRVRELYASEDNQTIERIILGQQATLKPNQPDYDPLIDVKGLPCWPSTPLYDQLVEGKVLKENNIDLESYCANWADREEVILRVGQEFDKVVLGIPVGALPHICCDLIKRSPSWKRCVDHVKTVRTQALQLWLKSTDYELGWTLPLERIMALAGINNPLNTWGNFSYLLDREDWLVDNYPLNIAYFCGPMADKPPLSLSECGLQEGCNEMDEKTAKTIVKQNSLTVINDYMKLIWPQAFTEQGFRWELLVSKENQQGKNRLDSQYIRANISPSERYTITVAGSSQYRLPAHNPQEFSNLYLAGDWTANHLNIGCVEAATMSGLLASHALSDYPKREDIVGVDWD